MFNCFVISHQLTFHVGFLQNALPLKILPKAMFVSTKYSNQFCKILILNNLQMFALEIPKVTGISKNIIF